MEIEQNELLSIFIAFYSESHKIILIRKLHNANSQLCNRLHVVHAHDARVRRWIRPEQLRVDLPGDI